MRTHIVKRGECLSSIAWSYGFARWQTIYDAPENQAFRRKRPNPNVIHDGDELVIPDRESKQIDLPTAKHHLIRVHRSKWQLRIELHDEYQRPIANTPFQILIEKADVIKGRTNKNGLLKALVPASATSATLVLQGTHIALRLGGLDPVRQLTGVQQRLNNLGFDSGPVDGIWGPKTIRALTTFQATQTDLTPTGTLDDDTLRRLLEIHDNDPNLPPPEEVSLPQRIEAVSSTEGGPQDGGWDGDDMTCNPPEPAMDVSYPQYFYFAIYYIDKDGTRAFERAADTWRKEAERKYNFSDNQFMAIELAKEEEFVDAWKRIDYEARRQNAMIREGHVFTHASFLAFETGIELLGSTLTHQEILELPQLPWHPQGYLVLHGCNSGMIPAFWSPAGAFAQRQGVVTVGQAGYAYFSASEDDYVEINANSESVFLRAYYRGKNLIYLPSYAPYLYKAAMDEFVANP